MSIVSCSILSNHAPGPVHVFIPGSNVAFMKIPAYDAGQIAMPRLIEVTKQRGSASFARLLRIKGVDVNVHWSVFVIAGIMLFNAGRKPVMTLVAVVYYMGLLLLHETGHLIAAQRRGSRVLEFASIRFTASAYLKHHGRALIIASSPGEEFWPSLP